MPRRMRDMRNPYGSRGGYVSSDRARRRDYARGRDRARGRRDYGDYAESEGQTYREPCVRYSNSAYGVPVSTEDEARRDRTMRDRGEYRPVEVMGRFDGYYSMDEEDYARGRNRDYNYDYAKDYGGYGMDYAMDEEELKHFEKKLKKQLDEKAKTMLEKNQVLDKAEKMDIDFEDYSEEEFYIVVLMMYTDFGKTLGATNPDVYIKMAKNWLEDDDSNLKYSDKLYEYLESIVEGE